MGAPLFVRSLAVVRGYRTNTALVGALEELESGLAMATLGAVSSPAANDVSCPWLPPTPGGGGGEAEAGGGGRCVIEVRVRAGAR